MGEAARDTDFFLLVHMFVIKINTRVLANFRVIRSFSNAFIISNRFVFLLHQ